MYLIPVSRGRQAFKLGWAWLTALYGEVEADNLGKQVCLSRVPVTLLRVLFERYLCWVCLWYSNPIAPRQSHTRCRRTQQSKNLQPTHTTWQTYIITVVALPNKQTCYQGLPWILNGCMKAPWWECIVLKYSFSGTFVWKFTGSNIGYTTQRLSWVTDMKMWHQKAVSSTLFFWQES